MQTPLDTDFDHGAGTNTDVGFTHGSPTDIAARLMTAPGQPSQPSPASGGQ
jgi:hypothetical protein